MRQYIMPVLTGTIMFVVGAVFGGWSGLWLVRSERTEAEQQIASRSEQQSMSATTTATGITTTALSPVPTRHLHQSGGSCGPFYALRYYSLSGELKALRPEDLPQMALLEDLLGREQQYVIVERVGSFTVKGPPIEIIRPNGGKTIDELDLADCATTGGGE